MKSNLSGCCWCLSICLKACVTASASYNTMMRQPVQSHGHRCFDLYVHRRFVRKIRTEDRRDAPKFPWRIFRSSTHGSSTSQLGYSHSFFLSIHIYAIAVVRYDASKSHIVGSIRRPRRLPRLVVDCRRSAGHCWEVAAESAAHAK